MDLTCVSPKSPRDRASSHLASASFCVWSPKENTKEIAFNLRMRPEAVEASRLAIGIKSNFNREPASEIFTNYEALKSPSRGSVDRYKRLNT